MLATVRISLLSSRLLSGNVKLKIYKTIIPPFVLYGCETWSHTLREQHRLRVFENRVLRRIFGRKRDEVTGLFFTLPSLWTGKRQQGNNQTIAEVPRLWDGHPDGGGGRFCYWGEWGDCCL
jgi:hypothetical protein